MATPGMERIYNWLRLVWSGASQQEMSRSRMTLSWNASPTSPIPLTKSPQFGFLTKTSAPFTQQSSDTKTAKKRCECAAHSSRQRERRDALCHSIQDSLCSTRSSRSYDLNVSRGFRYGVTALGGSGMRCHHQPTDPVLRVSQRPQGNSIVGDCNFSWANVRIDETSQ